MPALEFSDFSIFCRLACEILLTNKRTVEAESLIVSCFNCVLSSPRIASLVSYRKVMIET